LLREDKLKILKLSKSSVETISKLLSCKAVISAEFKEVALGSTGFIKPFILVALNNLNILLSYY
jgi:hypothetical protein